MNLEKWSLRIGIGALVCAVLFRLGSNGAFRTVAQALTKPEAVAVMMFLETGRTMRPAPLPEQETAPAATPLPPSPQTPAAVPEAIAPTQAVFSQEDAQLVEVNSYCGYEADVPAMILSPLSWDLTDQEPTVLIVHSHGSESYQNTENYKPSSNYRTLDNRYNMVSVGQELKQVLEAGGVKVIHDTTLHDNPSYNDSYSQSRKSVKAYLEQYPSIRLVLDLHRDALEDKAGNQKSVSVTINGKTAAKLMLVVGTDVRLSHPHWPENMSLAVKLHALLEKNYPGICRPISFRAQRFNQDLTPGALLVEVGAAGNTRQEALEAARLLGQAILELANGTKTQ